MINKLLVPFFKQTVTNNNKTYEYKITSDHCPTTSSFNANNNLLFLIKNKDNGCASVFSPRDYKEKDITDNGFFMSCYLPFLIKRKENNYISVLDNYPGIVLLNYFRNPEEYDQIFFANENDLHEFYDKVIHINWKLSDYKIILDESNFESDILKLDRFLQFRFDPNFNTVLNYNNRIEDDCFSSWVYVNSKTVFEKCIHTYQSGETPRLINTISLNDYNPDWIIALEYTDLRTEMKYGIEKINSMMRSLNFGKENLLTYLYLHNFVNSTKNDLNDDFKCNLRKKLEKEFSDFDNDVLKICDLLFDAYVKVSSCYTMEETDLVLSELKNQINLIAKEEK